MTIPPVVDDPMATGRPSPMSPPDRPPPSAVDVRGQGPDLAEVVAALQDARPTHRAGDRDQQQPDQDRDDGDHDQQLDEGEAGGTSAVLFPTDK